MPYANITGTSGKFWYCNNNNNKILQLTVDRKSSNVTNPNYLCVLRFYKVVYLKNFLIAKQVSFYLSDILN